MCESIQCLLFSFSDNKCKYLLQFTCCGSFQAYVLIHSLFIFSVVKGISLKSLWFSLIWIFCDWLQVTKREPATACFLEFRRTCSPGFSAHLPPDSNNKNWLCFLSKMTKLTRARLKSWKWAKCSLGQSGSHAENQVRSLKKIIIIIWGFYFVQSEKQEHVRYFAWNVWLVGPSAACFQRLPMHTLLLWPVLWTHRGWKKQMTVCKGLQLWTFFTYTPCAL